LSAQPLALIENFMNINTEYFNRSILVLETSLSLLEKAEPKSIERDMFGNAVVKGFELTFESAGKLLREALTVGAGSLRDVEVLADKDVLRYAVEHNLMTMEEVDRWPAYLDRYNATADFAVEFAEDTFGILPSFIADVRKLASVLKSA